MLVITRQANDRITLATKDGPITLVVVSVHGGRVQFGIDAPRSVDVLRDDAIRRGA